MLNRYGSLAIFLALAVLAAAAGAVYEAGEWYYRALARPAWTPPSWFIALAWAAAYVFAAQAAWQAWLTERLERVKALAWWAAWLALNVVVSWLYFGLHRPGWTWLASGGALLAALFCFLALRRVSARAAGLMALPLLWAAFLCLHTLASWTLSGGFLARFFL